MRWTPAKAILAGGLTVGILDILDAFIFFGVRGVAPGRILQAIAAGLLGPSAFQGGSAVMALGILLHFCIAFGIVLTYWLLSRALRIPPRHTLLVGLVYGLMAWVVMNFVVIPLSAAGRGPMQWPGVVNGLLIHAFGVGLPAVWFVHRAAGSMVAGAEESARPLPSA